MSSDDFNIRVEGLGKRYEIYRQPADRLRQMILPKVQRLIGRKPRDYFKEFWALRDVSFETHRGETVGIIGRNGSGKSTLLQMICGTLHPTLGTTAINGRIAALLELGAGFNPEFTGKENVFLSGLLYGIPEQELKKRYQSIVDFADIGDFIDQPVKTYSSGMYVRLAFAIITHVDADTLVIDEALSVGDVRFTQKCMRFLRNFQAKGTLLFVSHDPGAVINLCQRAIWLDRGKMIVDGPARDVVERYLAEQHAADRAESGELVTVKVASVDQSATPARNGVPVDVIDPRRDQLNGKASRNVIEIFEFDPERIVSEYGAGAAHITDVRLLDAEGRELKLTTGGEIADLVIDAEAMETLQSPIFGFYVKDRLGQQLFGDNTYLSYRDAPIRVTPGTRLRARFRFRLPVMPAGDYSIDAAIATGEQNDHTQQHWIRDALSFRASDSTMRHGLIGIPMHKIEIEQLEAQ
ncbi:MAG: ABC transporter ATP-binding protein [Rhodanobacteraceae bacterium]|nr:MAG: ABC transporter ATP-binding protein [Rhodanobacteraceae bacterium]